MIRAAYQATLAGLTKTLSLHRPAATGNPLERCAQRGKIAPQTEQTAHEKPQGSGAEERHGRNCQATVISVPLTGR